MNKTVQPTTEEISESGSDGGGVISTCVPQISNPVCLLLVLLYHQGNRGDPALAGDPRVLESNSQVGRCLSAGVERV